MFCWSCIKESCFTCFKRERKDSFPELPLNNTVYNVRRISSFGRTLSNEDFEKNGELRTENCDNSFLSPSMIPCDKVTITIQPDLKEDEWEGVKSKKRWKKALSKGHKKNKQDSSTSSKKSGSNKDKHLSVVTEEEAEKSSGDLKKSSSFGEKTKNRGNWNKSLLAEKKKDIVGGTCSTDRLMLPDNGQSNLFYSNPDISVSKSSLATLALNGENTANSEEFLSPSLSDETIWMKSQSCLDIKNLDSNEADSSKEGRELAKAHGLDLNLYQNIPLSKSIEAVNKARQTLQASGREDIFQELPLGTIFFDVVFDEQKKKLSVTIEKVPKLAGKGEAQLKYQFMVKLTVLPSEKEVHSTKHHHTIDRPINETFVFDVKKLSDKVLRFSVFDMDRRGKYDAVGHALFYLEDILQPFSRLHQMKLYKQSVPDVYPGTMQLTMSFNREKNNVTLTIKQIENLDLKKGKCKLFLKFFIFGEKKKEKMSAVVIYDTKAVFNFSTTVKIDPTGMKQNYIVICLKSKDAMKQNKSIGRLIIGPYFYAEDGKTLTPWGRVVLYNETISNSFRMYL
ncbi:uncharacterized protein LOC111054342 [Nilaparvata lugens]|uniref:uncharacterized protein LOC111054342 n=1 Tax=Nilaparvata lugens TaxID=108931 RepID=UPI00193DC757|nr:uncharacterized protein LOC111054342 [Nilaparvata lugens]